MLIFQPGDYMFTFDLKSGYHHVDIQREHWKYLGFEWGEGPTLQYDVFCVLPFGLATAYYLFTKLLRPWLSTGDRRDYRLLFILVMVLLLWRVSLWQGRPA